jgi:diguanylate cyclase (GGDEF)-like protein
MDVSLLRNFYMCSREWARATDDVELIHIAAKDLQEFVNIHSGFLVYCKEKLNSENSFQKIIANVPWGTFVYTESVFMEFIVDKVITKQGFMNSVIEWVPEKYVSQWIQIEVSGYGHLQMGIWPLVSRKQYLGAIIVLQNQVIVGQCNLETASIILDACAAQLSLALDMILEKRIAEEASCRDLLTGLLNRRGFEMRMLRLVNQFKCSSGYLVLGLADLDSFKHINDTMGHPVGDDALRQVARIISCNIRTDDLASRFGGDEFIVLLKTDRPDAGPVMKRIQDAVRTQSNGYTISVGGAVWELDGGSLNECYRVADKRLYDCKRIAKSHSR